MSNNFDWSGKVTEMQNCLESLGTVGTCTTPGGKCAGNLTNRVDFLPNFQQHVKCACENKVNDRNPHAEIMCACIANHWMLSVLKCVAV